MSHAGAELDVEDAANPIVQEAAHEVIQHKRRNKGKETRERFADMTRKGSREKARKKELFIKHELRRFSKYIPELPVVSPNRVVNRDTCAYFGGKRVIGQRVEAYNDFSKQWKRGIIAEEGSATRRHGPPGSTIYHVLVVVKHDDGTKKAYRCECLRKLPA